MTQWEGKTKKLLLIIIKCIDFKSWFSRFILNFLCYIFLTDFIFLFSIYLSIHVLYFSALREVSTPTYESVEIWRVAEGQLAWLTYCIGVFETR